MVNVLNKQVTELTGETSYTTDKLENYPLYALTIYGKSVQDGTPTLETPVDIVSVGDDGNVKVTACGKNLIHYPYVFGTQNTNNGITYVSNDDGSITINGTSTNVSTVDLAINPSYFKAGQVYTISGKTENIDVMVLFTGVVWGKDTFSVTEQMLQNSTSINVQIRIVAGVTIDNVTIYPQLEIGSVATKYEPYTGSTTTITSGLPLCSIGDVRDELIYNADGTGKIIKRVTTNNIANYEYFFTVNYSEANSFVQFNYTASPNRKAGIGLSSHFKYSTNNVGFHYVSNTLVVIIDKQFLNRYDPNAVDSSSYRTAFVNWCKENSPVFLLALATPQEIKLSAVKIAELQQFETLNGVCNIYNSGNGEMYIRAMTAGFEYGHEVGFFDSKI